VTEAEVAESEEERGGLAAEAMRAGARPGMEGGRSLEETVS